MRSGLPLLEPVTYEGATIPLDAIMGWEELQQTAAVVGVKQTLELEALTLQICIMYPQCTKFAFLGGALALAVFSSEKDRESFIAEDLQSLGGLVSWKSRWTPTTVVHQHFLWITMVGVPIHAWNESSCRRIVAHWGELVA